MVEAVDDEEDMDIVEIHRSGVPIAGTPPKSVSNTTKTSHVLRAKRHYHEIPALSPKSELTSPQKWRMLVIMQTTSVINGNG